MRKNMYVSCLLALSLLIPARAGAVDKTVDLNYSTSMMSTHPVMAHGQLPYWKKLAELSDGGFKLTYFEPGTLVADSELLNGVVKGIVGMSGIALSKYKKAFPVSSVQDLPMGYPCSSAAALSFIHAYQEFPIIQKEFSRVKVISSSGSVPNDILSIKPIKNLEDLQGKRVGVLNGGAASIIKTLGATPIQLSLSDFYTSLQRGMLDAALLPIPTFKSTKVTEVAKYLLDCNVAVVSTFSLMSPVFFTSLDKKSQDLINSFSMLDSTAFSTSWVDRSGVVDLEFVVKNHGVQVTSLSKEEVLRWREKLAPLFDDWKADVKKVGGDPDAILACLYKWSDYYSDHANVLKERAPFYEKAKDWGCLPPDFME